MPFDMGFNFRATSGYVSDPAYGVHVDAPGGGENYPVTKTNVNGDSVDCGWTATCDDTVDRDSAFDARLAGIAYRSNASAAAIYRIDLASGTCPGAGTYTLDIAAGDANAAGVSLNTLQIFDNATMILDLTNGGAGYAAASNAFIDATGVSRTRTAGQPWNGATINKVFASTTLFIKFPMNNISGTTVLAHFRLTAVTGGADPFIPNTRRRQLDPVLITIEWP
jgi:hypothetical protein